MNKLLLNMQSFFIIYSNHSGFYSLARFQNMLPSCNLNYEILNYAYYISVNVFQRIEIKLYVLANLHVVRKTRESFAVQRCNSQKLKKFSLQIKKNWTFMKMHKNFDVIVHKQISRQLEYQNSIDNLHICICLVRIPSIHNTYFKAA